MRMRTWATAFGVAAVLAMARGARAQDANYMVITNDGSTYEGQLVENVVGNHVTIKLVSGELRTFQASDVRSQGPAAGPATTPTPPAPNLVVPVVPPAVPLPQPGEPGGPPVSYDGPDAVQIHIEKANAGEGKLFMETPSGWAPVCVMPCTTKVDPKIDYKLYNSDAFRFPAGPPLALIVDTSQRSTLRALGGTMIGVGAAGAIVAALDAAGLFSSNPTPQTPQEQTASSNTKSADLALGLTILGASAAVLTVGIVLCALHSSPTLTTSTGQRLVEIARHGLSF